MVSGFIPTADIADAFGRTLAAKRRIERRAQRASRRANNAQQVMNKFTLLMQAEQLLQEMSPSDISDHMTIEPTYDLGDLFGGKIEWTVTLTWDKGNLYARLKNERGRVIVWTRVNGHQSDEPEAHVVHKLGMVIRRKLMRMALDNRTV